MLGMKLAPDSLDWNSVQVSISDLKMDDRVQV